MQVVVRSCSRHNNFIFHTIALAKRIFQTCINNRVDAVHILLKDLTLYQVLQLKDHILFQASAIKNNR